MPKHTHTHTYTTYSTCVSPVSIFCIHKLIQRIESGMQTKDKCLSNICLLSFFSPLFPFEFRICVCGEWMNERKRRECVESGRGTAERVNNSGMIKDEILNKNEPANRQTQMICTTGLRYSHTMHVYECACMSVCACVCVTNSLIVAARSVFDVDKTYWIHFFCPDGGSKCNDDDDEDKKLNTMITTTTN